MSHNLKPVAGEWYRHLDKGQSFRVLSVERDEDLIEIQHFDGDLEELEFAEWFAMDLEPAAEPEDWTGPMDDVETDDLGYSETAMADQDWRASLDANKPPAEKWEDETPEEERDQRDEGEPTEETSDTEP
jgi:hypothetical protein